MQVKLEIVGPESNIPPSERKNVNVEVHMKRGDTWNVVRTQQVLEGDTAKVWDIPPDGRLIITTPEAIEDMVYDRDQAASVRRSAQENVGGRADRVSDNIRPTSPPGGQSPLPPNQGGLQAQQAPQQAPGARVTPQQPQPRVQTAQQPQPAFQPPGSKGDTPDPATKAAEAKKE